MKNFKVGKEIKSILASQDDTYLSELENKIFPLIAQANTTFPFMVYRRAAYRPASTKDGIGEIVTVDISIATPNYEDGVNIADAAATALVGKETNLIQDITLTSVGEDYIEDTFIQTFTIDIELK